MAMVAAQELHKLIAKIATQPEKAMPKFIDVWPQQNFDDEDKEPEQVHNRKKPRTLKKEISLCSNFSEDGLTQILAADASYAATVRYSDEALPKEPNELDDVMDVPADSLDGDSLSDSLGRELLAMEMVPARAADRKAVNKKKETAKKRPAAAGNVKKRPAAAGGKRQKRRVIGIPPNRMLLKPNGCTKCKNVVGCTDSCWVLRWKVARYAD